MKNFGILIISAFFSAVIFSFLFHWLNYSVLGLFKPIQIKVDSLNEKNKRKLKVITYILIIIPILIIARFNMNSVIVGLIIGLLITLRDICFIDGFIEIAFKNDSKDK